jgi:uncharacterized protein (DUF924 family)
VIDDVLAFWFGPDPSRPSQETMQRWFAGGTAFDAQIRDRFAELHAQAVAGELQDWLGTARGELALVIVLDQFSRHLYRNDPRAFAQDSRALAIARNLYLHERADELTPIQRMFVLLPFEHAEDASAQRECVAEFEKLVAANPADPNAKMLENGLDYAKQHAVIIERFGRFPHRNEVLGRESTPDERAFLQQPGSRF